MKRLVTLALAAVLTFPLVADEPKKTEAAAPAEVTAVPADAAAAPAEAPGAEATAQPVKQPADDVVSPNDSPLVAASKRAKRRNRKPSSEVITNETLKTSKGHVTTTKSQHPVNVPAPKLTPEEQRLQEKKELAAHEAKLRTIGEAEKKKEEEAKQRKRAAAAHAAEEGMHDNLEDDPAMLEAAAEEAAQQQKPPV
jgi:hypothetical protein